MLTIVLSQNGKSMDMHFTNANYMNKFAAAMTDMSIIVSLWAGGMEWLDGGEGGCGSGGCNLAGTSATISNMKLEGGSGGGGDSPKFSCDASNKVCTEDVHGSQSYNDCYSSCVGGGSVSGFTFG